MAHPCASLALYRHQTKTQVQITHVLDFTKLESISKIWWFVILCLPKVQVIWIKILTWKMLVQFLYKRRSVFFVLFKTKQTQNFPFWTKQFDQTIKEHLPQPAISQQVRMSMWWLCRNLLVLYKLSTYF